jgi:hypothetical protein
LFARDQLITLARRLPVRELLLLIVLATAAALVVRGVAGWDESAAYIVAGLLTAGLGVLFMAEAG